MGAMQDNAGTTVLLCLLTLGVAIVLGVLMVRDISDRKAAEIALKQSEARYRAIVEDQTELICRSLPDTTVLFANNAYCRYFGVQLEELIGKPFLSYIHAEEQEDIAHLIQALSCTNPTLIKENRVVANGEVRWMQWVDRALFDEQGNVTEIQSVGRDITDLKHIEEALRSSEANLLQAQQVAHLGSWEVDLTTQENTWSAELFRILGLDPTQSEPSFATLINLIPVEDRDAVVTAIREMVTGGASYDIEHRVQRLNGSTRYVISKGEAVLHDQQVLKLYGTILDITDLRRAEAALQESEARFRQLAETVREGFFIFETSTSQYSYLNPAYISISGIPSAPSQEDQDFSRGMTHWLSSIHPGDRDRVKAALQQERQGEDFNEEYRFLRPNGELRWLRSQAFPIKNAAGNIVRIVGTVEDITDRKQAEIALQESEARFQEIAQTLNQVSYVISLTTGQYLYISPSYEKLWGYSCESLYQNPRSWLERIYPEDLEYVLQGFDQLLFGRQVRLQYRIICANGEVRWVKSESLIVYDDNGNPSRVVGLADDVTDQKWLEQSLQLSEARYRAIIEDQMELVCRYQPDGTLTFANEAFCRYFGLDPKEGLGSHYEPLVFAADRDRVNQLISSMSQDNPTVTIENRVVCQGEVRWTQWNNRAIFEQGQFIEFQAVGRDITDRKQIEEALRDSEERFRRAFDDAPIGMSLISPTGQFLRANAYYCNLLGYTEAELLTLTFQDITYAADLESDLEGVQQMLAGIIRSFQMEKRYITKQGAIIPTLMKTAPIRDQDGRILYFVGHIQDLRERLRVERMKDEFISVISHELRTPLTSIRGALGILGAGVYANRPKQAQHMLEIAINNSDRLVRLINDILDLERLQSGKVELIMQSCQVEELLQQAVDSVQAIADQLAITLSLTSLPVTLRAAPDEIVQTLTNLLSNAIKFSSPGSTVWLKAELGNGEEKAEGRLRRECSVERGQRAEATQNSKLKTQNSKYPYLLFSITDQGRGIPADKLDMIFEQFQQVDVSDSRKKGGTGLGLAICKNIVQQHGGEIWVESHVGQGSTFYFTLPFRREAE